MRQHAEETGLEFNEEAMDEPLVEPARGKNIGILVIDSDDGGCWHDPKQYRYYYVTDSAHFQASSRSILGSSFAQAFPTKHEFTNT